MNTLTRCTLLLATLALAACDQTRFVSDPAGNAPICDADIAGLWVVDENERVASDVLEITDKCRVRYFSLPQDHKGGPLASDAEFSVNVARLKGTLYATLTHEALRDIANDTKPDDAEGYHVFRLDTARNTLKLYDMDHKHVAKLIIDGTIKGEVTKTSDELRNVVPGEIAAIRALLAKERLFSKKPMLFKRGKAEDMPAPIRAALAKPWKGQG